MSLLSESAKQTLKDLTERLVEKGDANEESLKAFCEFMIDDYRKNHGDPQVDYVMDNIKVTGRKGKHTIKYRGRLVIKVAGRKFCLSEHEDKFFEGYRLTVCLPKNAMSITAVTGNDRE